jgi:probable rRNA maturation factor
MIHFTIEKRYSEMQLEPLLQRAAETAMAHQGLPADSEMSLVVTGDAELQKLNLQFLGEDRSTDVLSFPAEVEAGPGAYLGDVVISLPRARAQAKAGGHPIEAELQLLAVHGILHLAGHDHATAQQKNDMWAAQSEILKQLGLAISTEHAEQPHD